MYQAYLVDDDEIILEELVRQIPWLDNGFAVAGYSSKPQTALAEIARIRPDVVFSDLKMPGMDGLALLRHLSEAKAGCEFVMVSAYGEFEDTRSLFVLGGFDYLLKPVQAEDAGLLLERLNRRLNEKLGEPAAALSPCANQNFNELVRYITQNSKEKFTLEKLGRQFGLNPNYICNLFAKHYGTTLTRFVTGLRMQQACRLVEGSTSSLKSIAIDCGYPDYYHFFKVFKEHFGLSPTQYRKQKQQAAPGQGT